MSYIKYSRDVVLEVTFIKVYNFKLTILNSQIVKNFENCLFAILLCDSILYVGKCVEWLIINENTSVTYLILFTEYLFKNYMRANMHVHEISN